MAEFNQETIQDFLERARAAQADVDHLAGPLNAGGKVGWWNATPEGASLQLEDTGFYWGDGPADEMDRALANIVKLFQGAFGRKPTRAELEAGLKFSLGVYEEES